MTIDYERYFKLPHYKLLDYKFSQNHSETYLFFKKSGIWMSFFCTVLDGVFAVNGVAFIVGILKLGIFRFRLPVFAAGLLFAKEALLLLLPNGLADCAASLNPVAMTVILA